jgi:tetratricopeptide (TPR) repeat protein
MSTSFFMRFRWSDSDALAREIADAQSALAAARASGDVAAEIEMTCRFGIALIAADREAEAEALFSSTLTKACSLGQPSHTAWVLHHLATAQQYCGDRDMAQANFVEALDITTAHGLREIEHYIWHHRGRCFVEQGKIAEARICFEKALAIRKQLGDPRAERTQQAIAALDAL